MARPTHRFFVDPANNRLLSGVNANATGDRVRFFAGDTARVELHLVRLTGDTAFPAEAVSFADWMDAATSVSLAVGPLETPPTTGTFKVEFDGDLSDPIPATASAATVEAALNDLPSIVSAGGVSVSKIGEFYRVEFDTPPASELSFDPAALVPRSTVVSSTPTAGGPARLFRIRQVPVALATTWTAVPSASASLQTVAAWDGTNSTVRLTIAEARGGSFNLAFKSDAGTTYPFSLIPFDSSGSTLAGFVNSSALTETISVRQIGVGIFDISTPVEPFAVGQAGWTVDGSGLDSFVGLVGDLDFNTVEAETLLDGAESVEVAIEVEAIGGARYFTAYQGTASLLSDLVDNGPLAPVTLDDALGSAEAAAIYLAKADNLASLASAPTARTNLGLGTMATAAAADYLAKSGNLAGLASTPTARTNLGLGTMATETAADYLAKADNLAGLASTPTARTNLGLGTMATETATNYLTKAGNLSGLASSPTARANLGLGTMSVVNDAPSNSKAYVRKGEAWLELYADIPDFTWYDHPNTAWTTNVANSGIAATSVYAPNIHNLVTSASVANSRASIYTSKSTSVTGYVPQYYGNAALARYRLNWSRRIAISSAFNDGGNGINANVDYWCGIGLPYPAQFVGTFTDKGMAIHINTTAAQEARIRIIYHDGTTQKASGYVSFNTNQANNIFANSAWILYSDGTGTIKLFAYSNVQNGLVITVTDGPVGVSTTNNSVNIGATILTGATASGNTICMIQPRTYFGL